MGCCNPGGFPERKNSCYSTVPNSQKVPLCSNIVTLLPFVGCFAVKNQNQLASMSAIGL